MITSTKKLKNLKGFTLLELTVVMVVGLMIATISLTLFTQQLALFDILRTQRFMIREAPLINGILNSLISRANTLNVDEDNSTLTLTYIAPNDNTTSTANILFDAGTLSYQNTGGSSWIISTQLDPDNGVSYTVENGILTIKLTGTNGGEINYSTTPL